VLIIGIAFGILISVSTLLGGIKAKGLWAKIINLLTASFPPAVLFLLWTVIISMGSTLPNVEITIAGIALGLVVLAIGLSIFGAWKKKFVKRGYIALTVIFALSTGGFYGWKAWDDSILRVDDSLNILHLYGLSLKQE